MLARSLHKYSRGTKLYQDILLQLILIAERQSGRILVKQIDLIDFPMFKSKHTAHEAIYNVLHENMESISSDFKRVGVSFVLRTRFEVNQEKATNQEELDKYAQMRYSTLAWEDRNSFSIKDAKDHQRYFLAGIQSALDYLTGKNK